MFRKFVSTIALYIFSIAICIVAYWHPLDVSNTTMTMYDSTIVWVTYIHPVELDRILVNSGWMAPTAITLESYYSLTGILTKYLSETLQVTNQEKSCTMWGFDFQDWLMIDEVYAGWFPISYTFTCTEKIHNPIIKITFLNEVPLQTNRLYIYQTFSGVLQRTAYKVLNAKKDSHTLSLSIDSNYIVHDSDHDGLSDEDEILYNTHPNNPDTDGDGYSDFIEIQSSWNPLTRELSPWQKVFSVEENINSIQNITTPPPDIKKWTNLAQDATVWGGERFRNILRDIRLYIEWSTEWKNLWILLLSIWILGFLHAMWPWHSKWMLVSQIIDDGMSYPKSILYCLIFTAIHLIDIIVVVVITKLFFNFLDPSVYLSAISRWSAILVFVIGIYLIFFSIKKYRNATSPELEKNTLYKKNYLIMAVITGLTPCAFGWSIFLMLMAIGKMSLAPPLLLSLWIGIFLCLALIATITWFMKSRIYAFSPKISKLSPIISAVFILCIGTGLILNNF